MRGICAAATPGRRLQAARQRGVPLLLAGVLGLALAGCTGPASPAPSSAGTASSSATAASSPSSAPTTATAAATTPPPATAATASADPSAAQACADGVTVPVGVGIDICAGAPAGATSDLTAYSGTYALYEFMTPSGNIACAWDETEDFDKVEDDGMVSVVSCGILDAQWQPSADQGMCDEEEGAVFNGHAVAISGRVYKGRCDDVPSTAPNPWERRANEGTIFPTLAYGTSITHLDVACHSASDGLTCWNTGTHHGFKLSRAARLTW